MYVLVGSITTAMRLKRLLERVLGCPSNVVQTPSKLNRGGCSYSVRLDNRYLDDVQDIAREYSVNIRKIYKDELVRGERVFRAVP